MAYTHNGILYSHENGLLLYATTWMDVENIRHDEINQKDNHCMILSRIGKESRIAVPGVVEGGYCLMGEEFLLGIVSGDGVITANLVDVFSGTNCTLMSG